MPKLIFITAMLSFMAFMNVTNAENDSLKIEASILFSEAGQHLQNAATHRLKASIYSGVSSIGAWGATRLWLHPERTNGHTFGAVVITGLTIGFSVATILHYIRCWTEIHNAGLKFERIGAASSGVGISYRF